MVRDLEWLAYLDSIGAASAHSYATAIGQELWSKGMFMGTHKSNVTDYTGKYVIWSPEAAQLIQYVYDDRPSAIKVAHEMASKYPAQRFIVLKAVGVAMTNKVEFVDLEAKKAGALQQPRINGKFASKGDIGLYAPGTK